MADYSASLDFPIFVNDKREGNQPHRRGTIEITTALLKEMVEAKKRGEQPILQVACWENTAKGSGLEYLGCKLSMDRYRMNKALEDQNGGVPPKSDNNATEEDEEGLFD